jgi:hypothetical protein
MEGLLFIIDRLKDRRKEEKKKYDAESPNKLDILDSSV